MQAGAGKDAPAEEDQLGQGVVAELGVQLVSVAVVLAAFFIGPGLALIFLLLRKARRRGRRRSPLGINLLRGPGHSLKERLEEVGNDLTFDILTVTTIPLVMLALFLAQAHARGGLDRAWGVAWMYGIAVVGTIAYMTRKMVRQGEELDNLKTGYDAEVAVGQELDRLMRQGALVFHDFPAEGFNLDQVVLAPHGVCVVETKGYTKLMDPRIAALEVFARKQRLGLWADAAPVAPWEWRASAAGRASRLPRRLELRT